MKQKVLQVHPMDNVMVALVALNKGEQVRHNGADFILVDAVPAKHKFVTQTLQQGDAVIMYGVLVGKAQARVEQGALITTENLKHAAEPFQYRQTSYAWQPPDLSKFINRTFNGYHRQNGAVGTANYWLFIPTVFCENRNLDVIREALHNELGYAVTDKYKRFTQELANAYRDGEDITRVNLDTQLPGPANRLFKNVDGIKFLNHQGGCGGTRQDAAILGKLLAAYANHPNVGGITILSLGCQHLQVQDLLNDIKLLDPESRI